MEKNKNISLLYVVTRNHSEFLTWCRINYVNPNDRRFNYIPVGNYDCLQGIIDPLVIFYGAWYKRNDISMLKDIIRARTFEKQQNLPF